MRNRSIHALVIVSALGCFVDAFDWVIFSVVRKARLAELGVPDGQSLSVGLLLCNWQMAGMLIGGVRWGVIGVTCAMAAIVSSLLLTENSGTDPNYVE